MSLYNYLTPDEKNEIKELKKKLNDANTMREIRFYRDELNHVIDLAQQRSFTDPVLGKNRKTVIRRVRKESKKILS